MKRAKLTSEHSKCIEAYLLSGNFTYQDMLNDLDDDFTLNQLKYHITKNYPDLKKNVQKEYSRGGSKLEYLLKQMFPLNKIHGEYHVGSKLRLDFYIEAPYNLGFEFDGSQHKEYTPGFHSSHSDFALAQDRDLEKNEICAEYGINLIRYDSVSDLSIDLLQESVEEFGYGTGIQSNQPALNVSQHLARQASKAERDKQKLLEQKAQRQLQYRKAKLLKEQQYNKASNSCESPVNDYKEQQKERAREARKEQYQRQKEWKKKNKM